MPSRLCDGGEPLTTVITADQVHSDSRVLGLRRFWRTSDRVQTDGLAFPLYASMDLAT